MTRKEELQKLLTEESLYPIADEMVFLEERLAELKKLPFIKVHPNDPSKQKATPAALQYRGLLQQYSNIVKLFMKNAGLEVDTEESPLRKWLNDNT